MARSRSAGPAVHRCPACGAEASEDALRQSLWVCPACGAHLGMPARDRIASLVDAGTFREFDRGLISTDPLRFADQRAYRARLIEARRRTGLREAVVVGAARIGGLPVVLAVFEFAFLGGTMGSVVGEKIAKAFEVATRRRLPVVTVTASGGARMQEGMLSLVQMAKTAAARARHHAAGLAYVSVLAHPTFGGVTASFASLGDILIAEPGAQVGFVGPRVIEATVGEVLPPDSHRAERLFAGGMVDLVLDRRRLREVVQYLLRHLRRGPRGHLAAERLPRAPQTQPPEAWDVVQAARHPQRPTALAYIRRMVASFVELHGDRQSGDDPSIVGGLGEIDGQPVVVIGQERGSWPDRPGGPHQGMPLPEGYRESLRLMRLAGTFGLPVLTLIDTPGAYPGYEAELRGIAPALAANLQAMALLPTPVVAVVIGEGGSGGALALGLADRVYMLEHAFYSVISPEAAAAILYRDAARAPEVAAALKLTAADLLRLGVIDGIIPEPAGGAHADHDAAAAAVRRYVVSALAELGRLPPRRLVERRYRKYRTMGQYGSAWREVARGVQELLESVEQRLQRRPAGPSAAGAGGGQAG
ncbi:MAG: acetyl-CoA carboxylase carboxyltransferase subunit alpha/beta [Armatimonadota bacterium]|nr:acetyl-CoA carboxylase carboxyltransferase subunit alpha/beta [Armatimonadota bacterium]MDR7422230.1 acetyl-CoA carboxylase carboxyltransferase subunit alpha/beta [Armatimonadota bacterium]MDR7495706.1 acetyl-CoA carboxylase carboxyltransferase subunit alpha/beta [Armatimonadota bacterium]MDR7512298.1 acetyl-CoA carboxylase carboxyltransferase subunit alpha/beta [Armatimonadota bacterium]